PLAVHRKSSPQQTPTQSSSRPCTSNCVAITSRAEEDRTSTEGVRNHLSHLYRAWNGWEYSRPSARSLTAYALPTNPDRLLPRRRSLSHVRTSSRLRLR